MKDRKILFLTAFSQVCFVAMNIHFISKGMVLPMIVTGFMISLIWSVNVGKVAFGNFYDKLVYASGAAFGTYVGFYLSKMII